MPDFYAVPGNPNPTSRVALVTEILDPYLNSKGLIHALWFLAATCHSSTVYWESGRCVLQRALSVVKGQRKNTVLQAFDDIYDQTRPTQQLHDDLGHLLEWVFFLLVRSKRHEPLRRHRGQYTVLRQVRIRDPHHNFLDTGEMPGNGQRNLDVLAAVLDPRNSTLTAGSGFEVKYNLLTWLGTATFDRKLRYLAHLMQHLAHFTSYVVVPRPEHVQALSPCLSQKCQSLQIADIRLVSLSSFVDGS
ncbi:MAG: hypothetical protein K6U14_10785 [Firmicutes bacterium]|nr:hypothetical protein [Alicyclobacillaceae bacterium]MCL6498097.1 hypothetical protein [Bacillota bacterium]